jgi:uncharacterized protein
MVTHSALYEGTVWHRRTTPAAHQFVRPLMMPYLDLAEVPEVLARHPLWSAGRTPVSFRRSDYLAPHDVPLDEAVRRRVGEYTGSAPTGPIRMLSHLRTFGWCFNPISVYWCFDPSGTQVEAVLAEVSNTPWHERTAYVVPVRGDGGVIEAEFAKTMHVSPFLGMGHRYRLRTQAPGPRLTLRISVLDGDGATVLDTGMTLLRRPMTRREMSRALVRHALQPQRVSAAIHLEAVKLWRKRVPIHRHPGKVAERSAA